MLRLILVEQILVKDRKRRHVTKEYPAMALPKNSLFQRTQSGNQNLETPALFSLCWALLLPYCSPSIPAELFSGFSSGAGG